MKYCNPFHVRTPRTIVRKPIAQAYDPARIMAMGKAAALSRALDSIGKTSLARWDAQEATIRPFPMAKAITLEEARQNARDWVAMGRPSVADLIHGDRPWKGGRA